MSPALHAVLVGLGWWIAFCGFIVLVLIGANLVRGYRLVDRVLGPPSSDESFELGLLAAMDDAPPVSDRPTERVDCLEVWWGLEAVVPPHERPVA